MCSMICLFSAFDAVPQDTDKNSSPLVYIFCCFASVQHWNPLTLASRFSREEGSSGERMSVSAWSTRGLCHQNKGPWVAYMFCGAGTKQHKVLDSIVETEALFMGPCVEKRCVFKAVTKKCWNITSSIASVFPPTTTTLSFLASRGAVLSECKTCPFHSSSVATHWASLKVVWWCQKELGFHPLCFVSYYFLFGIQKERKNRNRQKHPHKVRA